MNAFELAKKYYPTLWNIERLKALVKSDKLTLGEYQEITGEDYIESV